MAAAFVQSVKDFNVTDAVTTTSLTTLASVTAGNFLVMYWEQGTDNVNVVASVADSASNAWATVAPSTSGTGYCSGLAYAYMTSAPTSITVTWTNTSNCFKWGRVLEFSGVASASPLDASNVIADTFAAGASGLTVTTTNANDLVCANVAQQHAQVYTVGGSFSNQGNQAGGGASRTDYCYRIVSATGAYSPAGTFAAADNYRGSIAAFKSSVAASPNPLHVAVPFMSNGRI